jgi:hypothetical protein
MSRRHASWLLAGLAGLAGDGALLIVAILAGALFFTHVSQLWPMIPGDLHHPDPSWRSQAIAIDGLLGCRLEDDQHDSRLRVDGVGLDCIERTCGRTRATELIKAGIPLAWHRITFKSHGDPDTITVNVLLNGHLMGWERTIQEDAAVAEPPGSPEVCARAAAARLVEDLSSYRLIEHGERIQVHRTDRHWVYERTWPDSGEAPIRERLEVQLAGAYVVKCARFVVIPGSGSREERSDLVPRQAFEAIGFSLLSAGGVVAAAIALRRLAAGQARLGPAAKLVAIVGALLVGTHALQGAVLFEQWDPLGPLWVSNGRELLYDLMDDLSVLIPLFFFLVAGDALDRLTGPTGTPAPRRADSLWSLGMLRWREAQVICASARGFLIGTVCGGVLAAGTLLAVHLLGARVQLQPRGFFFYPLNSASPPLITICFFTHIALLEELGYRFFAGTWLERVTRSRYLAIAIPAVVYGLCHTAFEFLPPADPWWIRPLLLMSVGAVWGWAFFRFDALTVVLSHLTCDLFIFNWPLLQLGSWDAVQAILAISLPLWPALVGSLLRLRRVVASSAPAA